jgi:hypothetical protein
MIITKENIELYIPQRAPFIMIDNLVDTTPEKFETDFLVLNDNIFLEEGLLREYALIENIAQTGSAGLATVKRPLQKKIAGNFIGGISKLKLYHLPKVDDTICTIVHLIAQLDNMFLLSGANYVNGRKLVECEIKLVAGKV